MPLLAAAGAFLGSTAGAATIATGAALVGNAIASGNASDAAQTQANDTLQATQQSLALQKQIYDQNRADNAPARQLGYGAMSALAGGFGLPSPTAPSTGTTGAPTASMTSGSAYDVPNLSAGSMTQPATYKAYLAANPDLAREGQRVTADGEFPSMEAYLRFHDAKYANENRPSTPDPVATPTPQPTPSTPQTSPMTGSGGYVAPSGYSDPTAPNGYTVAARPTMTPLNVSADAYHTSPGYDWQLQQGQNALDHVASAGGGIMSGQRAKAALTYSQGLANQDYTDWRNYTTGQYNADRNFGEATYEGDRANTQGRYDTRNSQLMQLAGFGQSANQASQNAATSFANNSSNLALTGAAAKGSGAVNSANAWSNGLNNAMTLGAYAYGNYANGGGGGGSATGFGAGAFPNFGSGNYGGAGYTFDPSISFGG